MKEFDFKTPKTAFSFSIPETWEEVSLGQFISLKKALLKGPISSLEILSSFSGVDAKIWANVPQKQCLGPLSVVKTFWEKEPPEFLKLPLPESIEIDGKVLFPPDDPGEYALIQNETMNKLLGVWAQNGDIKTGSLDELIIYSDEILALFFQPLYTNSEYDEKKAKEMLPKIRALRAVDSLPFACFFLYNSLNTLKIGLKQLSQPKKTLFPWLQTLKE
jgi:hypothetical protein